MKYVKKDLKMKNRSLFAEKSCGNRPKKKGRKAEDHGTLAGMLSVNVLATGKNAKTEGQRHNWTSYNDNLKKWSPATWTG